MESILTWKVSDTCIDCKGCAIIAPNNFDCSGSIAVITKQPESKVEDAQCLEAQTYCRDQKSNSIYTEAPPPPPSPTYASEVLDGVTYASNQ